MNHKDIATFSKTKEIIEKYNFHFKKSYGQNFIIDVNILNKIIEKAGVNKTVNVIEIGPGIGSLTEQLAKHAKKVVAYEIDQMLIPILQDTLKEYDNITVINEDILKANVRQMVVDNFDSSDEVIVVANLPYYITTPILLKLIEDNLPISRFCVMMQKEVAERLCGNPGTKDYNSLTIAVQYYTKPKIVMSVPNTVFIPKPNVDSSVLLLERRDEPAVNVINEEFFFKVVRGSFIQRRKTIYNNLKQSLKDTLSEASILSGLAKANIAPQTRGEALTIEQFARLSDVLYTLTKEE